MKGMSEDSPLCAHLGRSSRPALFSIADTMPARFFYLTRSE